MKDFQDGELIFECDGGCHDVVETHTADWNTAIRCIKDEGWRIIKDGQDWLHLCRDCKHDY